MSGHIKLDRKIMNWEWYKDVSTCKLFLHLLLRANWTDGIFRGEPVPRGSFVSTYKELAYETGLSEKNVRTALEHLKKTGEVAVSRQSKNTVFTIKNYCHYQSGGTITGTENGSQTAVKWQSDGISTGTAIEKEEKKKEINNNIYNACAREEPLKLFEDFWNAFPKHVSRTLAEQAYVQLLSTTVSLREEQVVAAAKNYAEACRIEGTQEKFISLPHNWLEKSKWVDYLLENYKKPEAEKPKPQVRSTGFSNFEQRDYDWDKLEKQLLASNRQEGK